MNALADKMEHRIVFVRFEKDAKTSYVNVTNDNWHVCGFITEAADQESFIKECEAFVETDKFKEALIAQRGY